MIPSAGHCNTVTGASASSGHTGASSAPRQVGVAKSDLIIMPNMPVSMQDTEAEAAARKEPLLEFEDDAERDAFNDEEDRQLTIKTAAMKHETRMLNQLIGLEKTIDMTNG